MAVGACFSYRLWGTYGCKVGTEVCRLTRRKWRMLDLVVRVVVVVVELRWGCFLLERNC